MNPLLASVVALSLGVASLVAADTPAKPKAKAESPKAQARFVNDGNPDNLKTPLLIKPDENIAYGPHRMQKLYFWRAKSDKPTPLLFYIHGGGWNDGTSAQFPDWLQIDFAGSQTIDRVVVYTLQDNYTSPAEPTDSMTFSQWGIRDFTVQGWNGNSWFTLATVTLTNTSQLFFDVRTENSLISILY